MVQTKKWLLLCKFETTKEKKAKKRNEIYVSVNIMAKVRLETEKIIIIQENKKSK